MLFYVFLDAYVLQQTATDDDSLCIVVIAISLLIRTRAEEQNNTHSRRTDKRTDTETDRQRVYREIAIDIQ